MVASEIIAHYVDKGWKVVVSDESGVSLVKSKQWSVVGLAIGVIGLFLFIWPGVLILLLTLIDYAVKKDRTFYVSFADVTDGVFPPPPKSNTSNILIGIGIFLTVCVVAFLLFASQNGSFG